MDLDTRDLTILAVRDIADDSAGDRFLDWMHPLHNGEAFGMPGRLFAAVGSLLPLLLFVTGWLRWRHKTTARKGATQALAVPSRAPR